MRGRGIPSTRRGSALVLSLIAVVTLAAVGAAFLRITTALTSRQTGDVENMKAFYLAEAGLAEGFQAVRMGRTGQIGSEALPAAYGDGMVWVDATVTANEQVRLESTALVGRGCASLGYVVEPVKIPLGFFGNEELVVESVLLVDGWDSTETTYAEAAGGELKVYADWLVGVVGTDYFLKVVMNESSGTVIVGGELDDGEIEDGTSVPSNRVLAQEVGAAYGFTTEQKLELEQWLPSLAAGYPNGYDPAGPSTSSSGWGDPTASDPTLEVHTEGGGLLGSNGNVSFQAATGEPVAVYGDVTPGPSGSILGAADVSVTGNTAPRPQLVELPTFEVPTLTLAAPIRHTDLLPLLVPAGAVGYERIEVAPDAELILQGPSTVVIGTLILEPGATLSLDTRDGDVALYVTEEMDLQAGSLVATSEDPTEATVLVPEIPTGLDGAPIRLDATAQFHGTIYAPLTDVHVGGDFEIYGGVIAKRLEIGAGARLHFDNAGFEDSPIPRIVAWRILEIPGAVRRWRDPFEGLGLAAEDLDPIAECHDLSSVQIVVTYLDHGSILRTYEGTEDLFDWDLVAEVVEVDRDPEREVEEPTEPVVTDPIFIRPEVQNVVTDATVGELSLGGNLTADLLTPLVPLSADEWNAVKAIPGTWDPDAYLRLQNADLDAGGTGGL